MDNTEMMQSTIAKCLSIIFTEAATLEEDSAKIEFVLNTSLSLVINSFLTCKSEDRSNMSVLNDCIEGMRNACLYAFNDVRSKDKLN